MTILTFARANPGIVALAAAVVTVALLALWSWHSITSGQSRAPQQITVTALPVAVPPVARRPTTADIEVNQVLDGSQRLKDAMKKPETFELTQAIMIDGNIICYRYKARNSFNDVTLGQYVVSKSVSTDSAKEYLRLCGNRSGTDYTYVRSSLR